MKESKIEVIGQRISTLKTDEVSSFVIIPTATNWKLYVLFAWLFLWTVSGVIIMANYATLTNANQKIMWLIWLGFWAYFEFKIGRTFIFKKFGKEKIWIKNGKLNYWRDMAGRGKKLEFDAELLKDLQVVEKNKRDFFQFMDESFWVMGSESISFGYGAKTYRMGIQLNEEDARELLKQIKYALQ